MSNDYMINQDMNQTQDPSLMSLTKNISLVFTTIIVFKLDEKNLGSMTISEALSLPSIKSRLFPTQAGKAGNQQEQGRFHQIKEDWSRQPKQSHDPVLVLEKTPQ
jgi:hypothetical protein